MPRVTADISEELNARLKSLVLAESGKLRGDQGKLLVELLEEGISRREKKAAKKASP